jgi:hypothetical protein
VLNVDHFVQLRLVKSNIIKKTFKMSY